jgi:hypothetical protein
MSRFGAFVEERIISPDPAKLTSARQPVLTPRRSQPYNRAHEFGVICE